MSFFISTANHHILALRLTPLMIKMTNPYMLFLATALIGGLVAGFASLTASFARRQVY